MCAENSHFESSSSGDRAVTSNTFRSGFHLGCRGWPHRDRTSADQQSTYLVDMTQRTLSTASLAIAAGLFFCQSASQAESINAGEHDSSSKHPFAVQSVAEFDTPWAMAFLPDGRMLITEKPGRIFLATQNGEKLEVGNVPAVAASGQNGLLDIAIAPDFATSSRIHFTYVEPGEEGSRLVLSRATLSVTDGAATLADQAVIWRQTPAGGGGQPGGIIAFDPQGTHLFLTVGDRMRPNSAQ